MLRGVPGAKQAASTIRGLADPTVRHTPASLGLSMKLRFETACPRS